jgi:type IV pilus assembly protein PilC
MPVYRCTAIDNQGTISRSTAVAADESAAAMAIIAKGLTPLSITEEEEGGFKGADVLRRLGFVRLREVTLFLRMMAALLGSGITITEAMAVLHEQTLNRRFRYILGEAKLQIEGGVSLSDALGRYPRIFPETAVQMIKAGELGGIIENVLHSLVTYLEKRAALQKMMIRSLIYPSIILVVAIGVVIFLVTFVIPRFAVLLQGATLPWNTQFLLDLADFLIGNAAAIIGGIAAAVVAIVILFLVPETRQVIDRVKIHLPIIGPIARFSVIVRFCRTFGSLLASGITLVEALQSTRNTLNNQAARKAVDRAMERVIGGESLSDVLKGSGLFTSLMLSMIRIGEQSGNMDSQVLLVADIYEQQLEDRINWMSSMMEPALIISIAGIVGFVAWALVAGMLALYTF